MRIVVCLSIDYSTDKIALIIKLPILLYCPECLILYFPNVHNDEYIPFFIDEYTENLNSGQIIELDLNYFYLVLDSGSIYKTRPLLRKNESIMYNKVFYFDVKESTNYIKTMIYCPSTKYLFIGNNVDKFTSNYFIMAEIHIDPYPNE